jgi:hypothetical protein
MFRGTVFGPATALTVLLAVTMGSVAHAYNGEEGEFDGPYSTAMANVNPAAPDAGIPGHIGGPDGDGDFDPDHGSYVNPIFKGWATGVASYTPSDQIGFYGQDGILDLFADPQRALGPVSNGTVVCLGDMHQPEIDAYLAGTGHGPGQLTLTFDHAITNGTGSDFAAFENGFISDYDTGAGSGRGEVWAELAFVEVSTDGIDFARFPSEYMNHLDSPPGSQDYLTLDPTNLYNLVGKHVNAYGRSWGTPFDLDDLLDHDLVLQGLVDLNEINYVRIVDIPGNGTFTDSQGNAIYDGWVTWGTGGADFDALGVINQVPEPTSLALLGLGGLILGRRSRKTN